MCGVQGGTYSQTEESLAGILGAMDSDIGQPEQENKEGSMVMRYRTTETAVLVARIGETNSQGMWLQRSQQE